MNAPVLAPFDAERFQQLRASAGVVWGEHCVVSRETGSTNDDALAAAKVGAPHGSVFVAEHQSRGRGRSGAEWQARAGESLLFSLLLRPQVAVSAGAALTLSVGLGVRAALAPYSAESLAVKWPNDVLAGGRKLAGILCEGQVTPAGELSALVIGTGINVFARSFSAELAPIATSLALAQADADAALPPREFMLVRVLLEMERYLERCFAHGFAALSTEFAAHDALVGQRVVVSAGRELTGVARGVDGEGRLLVETLHGLERISSGTVRVTA